MLNIIKEELAQGKKFIGFMALRSVSLAILFLVPLILAGFLSAETFGAYSLAMMIVYFLLILIQSSQGAFIIYASKELKESDKMNLMFTARTIMFICGLVIFLLIAVFFYHPITEFASLNRKQFIFLMLTFFGFSIQIFIGGILVAFNKLISNALYELVSNIFSIVFILTLLSVATITLEGVFFMWFIAPVTASLFFLRKIDFSKLTPFEYKKSSLKKIFDYAKWAMIGGTAVYFVNWGDNLVLRYFVSMDKIGEYNLGYSIFKGVITLFSTIGIYFLPSIAKNIDSQEAIKNYLYKKRPRILLLFAVCSVFMFFILPYFFSFVYGNKYPDSALVAQILVPAILFGIYWIFYGPIFYSMGRYRFMEISNIFLMILNLGLDVVFVKYYGLFGAAIATTISYGIMMTVYEFYFRKYCKPILFNKDPHQHNI